MEQYGLVGYPLGHTMSPFIHRALFQIQGKETSYRTIELEPERLKEAEPVFRNMQGINVTIPYKQKMLGMMDELDAAAAFYSALNTIAVQHGKMKGYNTDAFGFLKALESNNVLPEGRVLVYGCGGAGRMMAMECALSGSAVALVGRHENPTQAEMLQAEIQEKTGNRNVKTVHAEEIKSEYDLLIHATPVGMYPNGKNCLVEEQILSRVKVVFDAVYNPEETLLLQKARATGAETIGGMPMLVWQAVKAHEIWYGAQFEDAKIIELMQLAAEELKYIFKKNK